MKYWMLNENGFKNGLYLEILNSVIMKNWRLWINVCNWINAFVFENGSCLEINLEIGMNGILFVHNEIENVLNGLKNGLTMKNG